MPAVWALISALFAAIGPWIMRFFAQNSTKLLGGILLRFGIVLATNELLVQPIIDFAVSAWSAIPPQFSCWMALMGVTKAASIWVSGLTLIVTTKIFFQRRAA